MNRTLVALFLTAPMLWALSTSPAAAPRDAGTSELPVDGSWALRPVWDDGQAEVSTYDAVRTVYGKPRGHATRLIVVKEDLDAGSLVKADPPYEGRDLIGVLKMNVISSIRTDNYPYHYMASIFLERSGGLRLVKASASSQEWCGTTFKEILGRGERPLLHYHSYFDGEARGEAPLPPGALVRESLLLRLRAVSMKAGEERALELLGPLLTNRGGELPLVKGVLRMEGAEMVEVPAGKFEASRYALRLEDGTGIDYWIGPSPARLLLKVLASNGDGMTLRETSRRDYWSR